MATFKDTDYLSISSRVRFLETKLLTRADFEKLAEATSVEETVRLLREADYEIEIADESADAVDEAMEMERDRVYRFLTDQVKNPILTEVARLPYDYQNIKSVLKAERIGVSPQSMLLGGGTLSREEIFRAVRERDKNVLTGKMSDAVVQASLEASTFRDPQRIDLVCDRICYEDMAERALAAGMPFVADYVKAKVDTLNILAFFRITKMGLKADFFSRVFIGMKGGLSLDFFLEHYDKPIQTFLEALQGTPYGKIVERLGTAERPPILAAEAAVQELLDEKTRALLAVPFGPQVPFAFLMVKEKEWATVRMILSGKAAGLSAEKLMERVKANHA